MQIRKNLISDIELFLPETINLYNINRIVKKSEYFNFMTRISALNKDNFDSEEKYKHFLKYINQDRRRAERHILENQFKEDYLNDGLFLWMYNYLNGIVSWLK